MEDKVRKVNNSEFFEYLETLSESGKKVRWIGNGWMGKDYYVGDERVAYYTHGFVSNTYNIIVNE